MLLGYGITTCLSVMLLLLYVMIVKNKEFWLLLLFACITLVNLGYFLLASAKTIGFAIFANDLAYLGSVFLSTCMFLTILKLCGFSVTKRLGVVLISCAILMFLVVATSGFLPWYYKSVKIEISNGVTTLIKEYGKLHSLYLIYLVGYFVSMISVIIYSFIREKGQSQKIAGFLAFIVLINISVWFFEKFIENSFEFLSVSYVVSEILFILLYWLIQDYVHQKNISQIKQGETPITSMPVEVKLNKVLETLKNGTSLAVREREILELILQNKKRKDIASELMISENTVKTYTRSLYSKLGVASRNEIYELVLKA